MLKAILNHHQTFEVLSTPKGMTINQQPFFWDLIEVRQNQFHILYNHRSFNAEVIEADYTTKSFSIKINGHLQQIQVKDRFDQLLDELGISNATATKTNSIKAPMPGKIVEIKVAIGDVVAKGDIILILEAMKMENIIKSPADATVKNIRISQGETVDKNQLLIEFE